MLAKYCQTRSGHPIKKFRTAKNSPIEVKSGNLLISQTSGMVSNFFGTQSPLPCAGYRILSSDSIPGHLATSTVTYHCQLQLKWKQLRQTVTNLTSLSLRSINFLVTTLSQMAKRLAGSLLLWFVTCSLSFLSRGHSGTSQHNILYCFEQQVTLL